MVKIVELIDIKKSGGRYSFLLLSCDSLVPVLSTVKDFLSGCTIKIH